MPKVSPIEVVFTYYPFYHFYPILFFGFIIVYVTRNRMGIGVVYAIFPLLIWYPVGGLTIPIVELGFGVVQLLEMYFGLVSILEIVLLSAHIY